MARPTGDPREGRIRPESALVLTATVSLGERRLLARTLKEAGFDVRSVDDAEDAAAEISAHRGPCVLVIDSGLLEMHHDGQWRALRQRRPDLAAVVRCFIKGNPGVEVRDDRTVLVHPDHTKGLLRAIRMLESEPALERA